MKKESSNWYIAVTHYLTANLAIPFIIGLIASIIFYNLGIDDETTLSTILTFLIILLSTWLGVMYSANYLYKTYLITDPSPIVKLSTLYAAILYIGVFILFFIFKPESSFKIIDVIIGLISIGFFYAVSKKYVKGNSEPSNILNP